MQTIGKTDLQQLAKKKGNNGKAPTVLWNISPLEEIHVGYYTIILKIAEMVSAGSKVKILVSDTEAMLQHVDLTEKQIHNRTEYYLICLTGMLGAVGIDMKTENAPVEFIKGSQVQLDPNYFSDLLRLQCMCDTRTVKQVGGRRPGDGKRGNAVAHLIWPLMFSLNIQYLGTDILIGSIEQKKLFNFARKMLPMLGYKRRPCLAIPIHSGLWTEYNDIRQYSKIRVLDRRSQIKRVIAESKRESLVEILEDLVWPLLEKIGKKMIIFKTEDDGGPINIDGPSAIKDVEPLEDLRMAVVQNICIFTEAVYKIFESPRVRQIYKNGNF